MQDPETQTISPDAITIRDAQAEDRETIIQFMADLQHHEMALEANRRPPEEMALPQYNALDHWSKATNGGFLVAVECEAIIGIVVFGIEEEFGHAALPHNQLIGRIADVYVMPDSREKGVGRMLIQYAEAKLRKAGARRAHITTLFQNVEARFFYETLGYEPYEVRYAKALY